MRRTEMATIARGTEEARRRPEPGVRFRGARKGTPFFVMRRPVALWVALLAVTGLRAAEESPKNTRITVELRDGSRLMGETSAESFWFTGVIGKVAVPLGKVRSLVMEKDGEEASLVLRNGDRVSGVPQWSPVTMQCLFGEVSFEMDKVRRIEIQTFPTRCKFWNAIIDKRRSRSGILHASSGGSCRTPCGTEVSSDEHGQDTRAAFDRHGFCMGPGRLGQT
jgi:hypothetical protein